MPVIEKIERNKKIKIENSQTEGIIDEVLRQNLAMTYRN